MSGKSARTSRSLMFLALAAVCSLQMGCGSGSAGDPVVGTKQGTVNVEGLKVGVPEAIIKDAVLTFVLDEQQAAKAGGRNQYLSRSKDSKGGQFSAQCKDGNCFRIEVIYDTPITKEEALDTLKKLLPAAAGEPKLRPLGGTNNTDDTVEKYDCGDTFGGEFQLTEAKSDKVKMVAATDKSKLKSGEAAKAAGDAKEDAKAADAKADEAKADDAKADDAKADDKADAPKEDAKSE
jgi:hypothetical protein